VIQQTVAFAMAAAAERISQPVADPAIEEQFRTPWWTAVAAEAELAEAESAEAAAEVEEEEAS